MKTTNEKIYIVYVYGTNNDDNSMFRLPYIFKSLENAKKFVVKEEFNKGKNYGSWTQRNAYLIDDEGQNFDDWRVE